MPNATPGAARVGWELYRLSGFTAVRDELIEQLEQAGFGTVSDRMYKHYRSLAAAGYDHYVSINRFDIARAAQPFEHEAASNRYVYRPVSRTVRLTVVRAGEPYGVMSQTERVSEAGALLVVNDPPTVAGIRDARLRTGEHVQLDFLDPPATVHARIAAEVEIVDNEPASATIEVEFSRLRPVSEFTSATPMDADHMVVRLAARDDGPVPLDVVGRRVFYLFEALEIARSLVNEVIVTEATSSELFAQPLEVERLSMQSPIEVLTYGAPAVVTVLGSAWAILRGATALAQQVQDARLTGAQVKREQEETRRVALHSDRIEDENQTSHLIHRRIREILSDQVTLSPPPADLTPRFVNLVEKQIASSVEGLVRQDVNDVEIRRESAADDQ